VVLERVEPPSDPGGTATQRVATDGRPEPGSVTMVRLSPPTPPTPPTDPAESSPAPEPPPAPDADPDTEASPEPDPGPRQHRVQPGDHLWSIAEAAYTDHLGSQPAAADLDAYWRTVVDANPQLVDPDLLYPGEEVVVPPPGNVESFTGRASR
jgi:nucleoid-associated protein YgaU